MRNVNYRKCIDGEIDKIIEVADKSFIQDRKSGFSFKKAEPQFYNNSLIDYSSCHFIAEIDNKFIAVAGNLINTFKIDNQSFKISTVGTVGTIPECRGQGHMKNLMQMIDKDNIDKNVDLSLLNGKRNRYLNYGYERAGFTCEYIFDFQQKNYIKNNLQIKIRPYKKSDLNWIYEIYLKNVKPAIRTKDNFENLTNSGVNCLYTIFNNNEIVGYLTIKNNSIVTELACNDTKYYKNVIGYLLSSKIITPMINCYNDKCFTVKANLLQNSFCRELDKICNNKILTDSFSIKVYNLKNFITLLYYLNWSFNKKNISESYTINDVTYTIKIDNNNISISEDKTISPHMRFDNVPNFVRFILGNITFPSFKSQIFPLDFGINFLDQF